MRAGFFFVLFFMVASPLAYAETKPRFVVYGGALVGGDGEVDSEFKVNCRKGNCPDNDSDNDELGRELSGPALGVDLLFPVTGDDVNIQNRWGLSLLYTGNGQHGAPGDLRYGSDLQINGVFELVPRSWETAEIFVRVSAGAVVLFPDDDLEEIIEEIEESLIEEAGEIERKYAMDAKFKYEMDDGPFVGLNYGVGAGADFSVAPDLAVRIQYFV